MSGHLKGILLRQFILLLNNLGSRVTLVSYAVRSSGFLVLMEFFLEFVYRKDSFVVTE